MDVAVKVDQKSIDRIFNRSVLSVRKQAQFIKSSLKRASKWGKVRVVRRLSKAVNLQQKILKRKVWVKSINNGFGARLSVYTNPINLIHFGARQNKTGVRSKRGNFRSAFLAKMPEASKPAVFKRTGDIRRMTKGRYAGKVREAISPVNIHINYEAGTSLKTVSGKEIIDRFWTEMKQRINYESSK